MDKSDPNRQNLSRRNKDTSVGGETKSQTRLQRQAPSSLEFPTMDKPDPNRQDLSRRNKDTPVGGETKSPTRLQRQAPSSLKLETKPTAAAGCPLMPEPPLAIGGLVPIPLLTPLGLTPPPLAAVPMDVKGRSSAVPELSSAGGLSSWGAWHPAMSVAPEQPSAEPNFCHYPRTPVAADDKERRASAPPSPRRDEKDKRGSALTSPRVADDKDRRILAPPSPRGGGDVRRQQPATPRMGNGAVPSMMMTQHMLTNRML